MAEKIFPPAPPPITRLVDEQGRPTKEFYDFILRLLTKLETENASLKKDNALFKEKLGI